MAKVKKPNPYEKKVAMISVLLEDRGWEKTKTVLVKEGTTAEGLFNQEYANQEYYQWQANIQPDTVLRSGDKLSVEFNIMYSQSYKGK